MAGAKALIWLALSVLAGLILSFAESQIAAFIQLFLKALGVSKVIETSKFWVFPESDSLASLLGSLCALILLRAVSQFLVNQGATVALESIAARMRTISLYDLLLNKSGRYVSASETNSRFAEIFPKASLCIYYTALCIPQLLVSMFLVALLFMTSAVTAAISLAGVFVIGLGVIGINLRIRRIAWRIPLEQKHLSQGVERVTRNWLLVRVLGTSEFEYSALRNNVSSYAKNSMAAAALANLSSTVPQTVGGFLLVGILLFNHSYQPTLGADLLSFLYLFLRLTQTLSTIANYAGGVLTYFPQLKASIHYCREFVDQEGKGVDSIINQDKKYAPLNSGNKVLVEENPPTVEISSVSFQYSSTSVFVLENFSEVFQSGEQTGIVGRSGSGKSTLLCLLVGILKPLTGLVHIDGKIPEIYFREFFDRIGFVGAEPFIVEGTVKDNLDYGASRQYSYLDYENALRQASLHDFIVDLPAGLNHKVSENGSGLSAGQKQRLAIARALLRNPLILLLDEVTANLDDATEAEIVESIAGLKGKTTVIFISHRRKALKFADKIVEIGP